MMWPPASRNDAVLAAPRELLPMAIGDSRRKRTNHCSGLLPQVSLQKSSLKSSKSGKVRGLPKGVNEQDVLVAMRDMKTRGQRRDHPNQLSLFPGTVIAHFGPGS